ncbi:MAG: hypothetical protein ACXVHB_29860 [Solirubrobacteraceae bacterium]
MQDVYVDVENDEPQFATVKGLHRPPLDLCAARGNHRRSRRPAGPGQQTAGRVRAEYRTARRGALPGRRIGSVSPLRAQLHAT